MPIDDRPPPYSRLDTAPTRIPILQKRFVLKVIFVGTAVTATIILLTGVILGAVSLDITKARKFSISAGILTLVGVMLLIATVPCCFFFWFTVDDSRRRVHSVSSSRSSSMCEVDRPAIVSDLYPEEFRTACVACQIGNCTANHTELPPPYDAPPPYTPVSEGGPV